MADPGLLHAILQGLVTGSYIALGAIGLGLVYNIAKVPNFAHGELLMVGAYVALLVNQPWELPIFQHLAEEGSLGLILMGLLFLATTGATLGIFYLLGGMKALKGSWWPIEVHPNVALFVHVMLALAAGSFVIFGAPMVTAGLLLSTVLVAALAPLLDRLLFRKFRSAGASLATLLIVTMGLAFIIRFSMQAIFTGSFRRYDFPRVVEVFGYEINMFQFKEFDLYFSADGVTLHLFDTAINQTMTVVEYSWLMVAVLVLGTVFAAGLSWWWRKDDSEGIQTVQTIGPRLVGGFFGLATFAVLAVVLAQSGSTPTDYLYSTQIRNSYFRISMIGIAIALILLLHILLRETKLGKAMRASADNLDLAKVTGINTNRVMMTTWIIAGAYAAIAGVFVGMMFHQIRPTMGFFLLLPLFAAVILGGLASIYGAVLGAYVVGLSMELGLLTLGLDPIHRPSIAFAVLLIVLLVKPEGIVGGN